MLIKNIQNLALVKSCLIVDALASAGTPNSFFEDFRIVRGSQQHFHIGSSSLAPTKSLWLCHQNVPCIPPSPADAHGKSSQNCCLSKSSPKHPLQTSSQRLVGSPTIPWDLFFLMKVLESIFYIFTYAWVMSRAQWYFENFDKMISDLMRYRYDIRY